MMEFGKSLRNAREAKGYTIAQIAETTHLLAAIVEGLENEDFSRIAAPIYGRNFVRLYCETVGLDPKPFVDEFMEILNGNHAPTIRERPIAPAQAPAETPISADPPVADPLAALPASPKPAQAPEQDLFSGTPEPSAPEPSAPEPIVREPVMPEPLAPEPAAPAAQTVSRYASTFRMKESFALPVLPWRLIVLGIAALVLLILIVFGIRALYSATTAEPAPAAEPAPTAEPAPAPAATPVTRTQQQTIPALYID